MTTYTYSIATDTATGKVDLPSLTLQVDKAIPTQAVQSLDTAGDALNANYATALSAADQTILTSTIKAHTGFPFPGWSTGSPAVEETLAENEITSALLNTDLFFPIGPNETWNVDIDLTAQGTALGGVQYAIDAPAGGTIEGWLVSVGGTSATNVQHITALDAFTGAVHVAANPGPDRIWFSITNGPTAGYCTLQVQSAVPGQTAEIFAGSKMKAVLSNLV